MRERPGSGSGSKVPDGADSRASAGTGAGALTGTFAGTEAATADSGSEGRAHLRIAVRVHDRAGALERVVGLIRRRALAVRRFSVSVSGGETLALLLHVDPGEGEAERVAAELVALHDVLEVEAIPADDVRPTRELALARVRAGAAGVAGGIVRRIAEDADGTVLEITGSPAEVDAALARLRERELITAFVRTGEVAVPGGRIHREGSEK